MTMSSRILINRLSPSDIANFWEAIKYGISQSVAPVVEVSPKYLNNILRKLLGNEAQVWVGHSVDETGKRTFHAMGVTYISRDPMSETRHLVVYALYGFTSPPDGFWQQAADALQQFAEANDCQFIVGYTNNQNILGKLAPKLGMEHQFSVVQKRV